LSAKPMLCAKDLEDCGGGRVPGQCVANVLALESCFTRSHYIINSRQSFSQLLKC
jgi:hypothetical protein